MMTETLRPIPEMSAECFNQVQRALNRYAEEVWSAKLDDETKVIHVEYARRFHQWMFGLYDLGPPRITSRRDANPVHLWDSVGTPRVRKEGRIEGNVHLPNGPI